jgi:hypothetical protein
VGIARLRRDAVVLVLERACISPAEDGLTARAHHQLAQYLSSAEKPEF